MNYGFHPAAEAEHLEQIAFYESRQQGLGARYRDHFLKTIENVCATATRYPIEHPPDSASPVATIPIDDYFSRAGGEDPSARRGALSTPTWIFVRSHSLIFITPTFNPSKNS
jgi:hypothetical protein